MIHSSFSASSGGSDFDAGPLTWILPEVAEALNRFRTELGMAADIDADSREAGLRRAGTFLHQAHGALQMLDLDGVPALTEAMEQIIEHRRAESAEQSPCTTPPEAFTQTLAEASQALLDYLNELQEGSGQQPLRLFPYYRAVLEAGGRERIDVAPFFLPRLDIIPMPPEAEPGQDGVLAPSLTALRQRFEKSLLLYLKAQDDVSRRTCASSIHDVLAEVERSRRSPASRGAWRVLCAFAEVLSTGEIAQPAHAKQILAQINLQLRRADDEAVPLPERLIRDALLQIATVREPTEGVAECCNAYGLAGKVPADYERKRYLLLDAGAVATARDCLGRAKGLWARVAAGDDAGLTSFLHELNGLSEFGAQLALSALQNLLAEMRSVALQGVSANADRVAVEMAATLLFLESTLAQIKRLPDDFDLRAQSLSARLQAAASGQTPPESADWLQEITRQAQHRQTMAALSGEIQISLRQAEKSLDAYFNQPDDDTALAPIDGMLHQIEGALSILDQHDAANAVRHARQAVAGFAADHATDSNADAFRKVAQTVGALSFFAEALQHDPNQARQRFHFDETDGTFKARRLEPGRRIEPAGRSDAPFDPASRLTISVPAEALGTPTEAAGEMGAFDSDLSFFRPEAEEPFAAGGTPVEAPDGETRKAMSTSTESAEAVPAQTEAGTSDEAIDAELRDIFLSEADEVLGCIRTTLPEALRSGAQEPMTTLRRSFHTLKGSSRMVGLDVFGEAAWSVERLLNVWLAGEQIKLERVLQLLEQAADEFGQWVREIREEGRSSRTGDVVRNAADRLREGEPGPILEDCPDVQELPEASPNLVIKDTSMPGASASAVNAAPAATQDKESASPDPVPGLVHSAVLENIAAPKLVLEAGTENDILDHAPMLLEDGLSSADMTEASCFPSEPEDGLSSVSDADAIPVSGQDVEAHHVLQPSVPVCVDGAVHGDTLLADASNEFQLTTAVADSVGQPVTTGETALNDGEEAGGNIIRFPMAPQPDRVDETVKQIGQVEISVPLHAIYLAETDELVRLLRNEFSEWRHEPHRPVSTQAVHAAHSLAGSSATVGLQPLQDLAHAMEMVLQRLARHPVPLAPSDYDLLDATIVLCQEMLGRFALSEMPEHAPAAVTALGALLKRVVQEKEDRSAVPSVVGNPSSPSDDGSPESTTSNESVASAETLLNPADNDAPEAWPETAAFTTPDDTAHVPHSDAPFASVMAVSDELDGDLLPLFIEEAKDLLPLIGETLRNWRAKPQDAALAQSLLRSLHTLKGSARMAGAMRLGQHLHELESRVEQLARTAHPSRQHIDDLLGHHDYGLFLFEPLLEGGPSVAPLSGLLPQSVTGGTEPFGRSEGVESPPVLPGLSQSGNIASQTLAPSTEAVPVPAAPLVRVRADILDRLINQAGEVSISRSRLENEVGALQESLGELTENVQRLRTQLRELEIQAETQIASSMAQAGDRGFDPLEFDRFTRLQELTRMMAESVNDVASVQQNIARTVDDAASSLVGQARLTRELQQDLMRVRMVPFGSIAERLYRLTRQTAKEVDKRVNLDMRGSSVEIDRSVLERMTGPFEHLLRNAIVHGIESREARRAVGKNETGDLLIEIRQEGNEVVIRLSDDGRGLDVHRIRDKAVSLGLIDAGSDVSESQAGELIFLPGFSTSQDVTELAGRGIGMDVVRTEAAALGGRIAVVSEAGHGTQFIIHLPLTLAVTQVVLLSTGGRIHAVPSVLVEQVVQLKSNSLASAYNDGALSWKGGQVPLQYLSSLLGDAATPVSQQYSPILVLQSGGERLAVHVDEVIGNREVVVKNVGPQLSRMIGVAGATVLGSGEVILILNPIPLAQSRTQAEIRQTPADAPEAAVGAVAEISASSPVTEPVAGLRTQRTIMVVDDSLTVRRVTQRLLSREGYQVVLAKDGVDALEQLQAVTPDVMLVDIEMPRMDGFDLTRNVRSDERTCQIPIIMITSRTAAKHRNLAAELGVNEYLGKPYVESDLLEKIAGFMGRTADMA